MGVCHREAAMMKYKKVEIAEQQLEDLSRQYSDKIEEGLTYVDHQRQAAGGRLDVLFVDSGRALVVAELKVVEDDGMLLQGLDYYDHVVGSIEALARLYEAHSIDPEQPPRLFLIAPTFSQTLINRCKWIDAPLSMFTYSCLRFDGADEIVPVFSEQAIPSPQEKIEVYKVEAHLSYMTDPALRSRASKLLDEVREWKPGRISIDAIKYSISMKVDGKVFAYFNPRRRHFIIATYNAEDKWTEYPVHGDDDQQNVLMLMRSAMDRRLKG
jgi:hypothetical protein